MISSVLASLTVAFALLSGSTAHLVHPHMAVHMGHAPVPPAFRFLGHYPRHYYAGVPRLPSVSRPEGTDAYKSDTCLAAGACGCTGGYCWYGCGKYAYATEGSSDWCYVQEKGHENDYVLCETDAECANRDMSCYGSCS